MTSSGLYHISTFNHLEILDKNAKCKTNNQPTRSPVLGAVFAELLHFPKLKIGALKSFFGRTDPRQNRGKGTPRTGSGSQTYELTGDDIVEISPSAVGKNQLFRSGLETSRSKRSVTATIGLETQDINFIEVERAAASTKPGYDEDGWPQTGVNLSPLPGVSAYFTKSEVFDDSPPTRDLGPFFSAQTRKTEVNVEHMLPAETRDRGKKVLFRPVRRVVLVLFILGILTAIGVTQMTDSPWGFWEHGAIIQKQRQKQTKAKAVKPPRTRDSLQKTDVELPSSKRFPQNQNAKDPVRPSQSVTQKPSKGQSHM